MKSTMQIYQDKTKCASRASMKAKQNVDRSRSKQEKFIYMKVQLRPHIQPDTRPHTLLPTTNFDLKQPPNKLDRNLKGFISLFLSHIFW